MLPVHEIDHLILYVFLDQMTTRMETVSVGGARKPAPPATAPKPGPGQQGPGYDDLPPPPPELMDQKYSQQQQRAPGM